MPQPNNPEDQEPLMVASLVGVDVKLLQTKLLERSREREIDGDALELLQTHKLGGRHAARLNKFLTTMERQSELNLYFTVRSHRKWLGSFIIFAKRLVRKLLKWLFEPLLEQQSNWNRSAYQTHVYQLRILQELEERMGQLEYQVESERSK